MAYIAPVLFGSGKDEFHHYLSPGFCTDRCVLPPTQVSNQN